MIIRPQGLARNH